MDKKRKVFFIVVLMLSSSMKMCLHGAPLEESIINTDLTGQDLIKMGNSLNKPLLSLLGATFVKTERNINKEVADNIAVAKNNLQDGIDKLTLELCKETRCAAWSEWSRCSANVIGTFGAKTRSRKCGGSSSICSTVSSETVETDNQICQGTCNHTLTGNKFCIKLYNSVKTRKDALEDCHKDGGHLMNIDSELKLKDINEYFTNISLNSAVWIDGTRTLPNGDWKYEYGSDDSKFSMWSSGEPQSDDDCKAYLYPNRKWYGRKCTDGYYFLCEIL